MNNSSQTGLYQSANSSSSTLRPRGARLISYLGDDTLASKDDPAVVRTPSSTTPPRLSSRGVSPNKNTIVNRSKSIDKARNGGSDHIHTRSPSEPQNRTSGGQGLWESWSSFQGLASTLLGNETSGSAKDKPNGAFKTPVWLKQDKSYGSKPSVPKWGPKSEPLTDAAQDVIEKRKALVDAKKREALLLAGASENRDSLGRYKRRDSDAAATPIDVGEDAPVYLHKVQKTDTMAGVVIKYNCQAEPFRKINRFWPNDNIQTRTHVLIPLEGSTIKGRKVDSPYLTKDLFDPATDNYTNKATTIPASEKRTTLANGPDRSQNHLPSISSTLTREPLSLITSLSEDIDFKHDSWVVLPNSDDPVEILRVPRRALGYFPRARRKSNVKAADASATSTPKTSFDMLRHPPSHAAQISASLNASPVRRPIIGPRLNSGRQRSSSVTGNPFAEALQGPGGVGTLRGLRTEASRPGPADDPLNRKFAQYLPDFLPPEAIPRTGFSLRPTPRGTPRVSSDSIRSTRSNSNSSNLGEVGGAIEGWVKKMAGVKRERGAAIDKMGDLIELETNSESADQSATRMEDDTSMSSATEEALLNERFPIRGRVNNAYASNSGSGKDKGD
ncbi:hypothetical protein LTR10_019819 [Elasticomyces elasticus]|uniref:LysM domain-containing protein n=1 Tax=Exophiala sideris TaxID=1016849 RepID=A0ABR0J1L3_9EURO|nr:hypothetical protein LTR10_019819 [Elasticomyces elasticus]KAK5024403.1 hypothetical protein LTS07_008694 [Exophiala sideris]KAK5030915.1 hypothetical protein LTR13_007928 [Exophiala sideris]KAK5054136.1 hypothetical protein LTR69_009098 [Exophiala sideris]KAK5179508.1 hypothetical protein LTR44_008024 [Eurotiomycetes sp. CCFEE 6388]